jgi:hypothetical protein
MTAMSDLPERRCRVAGCFSPEEIRLLDQVLEDAIREALGGPAARLLDVEELRASLATSIMTSAATGDLEPARLKATALPSLGALARPPDPRSSSGRASG